MLLDLGAVTDVRNKEGKSPSDIAIENMQDSSLALIIRKLRGSGDFKNLPWSKIISCRMKKSIYSMLDCFIESSPISNEGTVVYKYAYMIENIIFHTLVRFEIYLLLVTIYLFYQN